ncbi:hypothetical protein AWR27_22550 [Spirosoma montaniterrae]|uniref:Uncharacterized protein n=2 Tax=Spirosoma montaniterrae TaxID=1178516 RepID=A0A1P9X2L0_9BACT|nr:hypothetical protein AWR27_22550 [Spirosoma montaniterrae]
MLRMARQTLAERERERETQPDSFAWQCAVESAQMHVDELTRQLVDAKKQREIELVEIRLTGKLARFGSLPMSVLGRISTAFEEVLVQAGRTLRQQETVEAIRSLFDVRLKAVAPGSTRLFITLQTNPDLFGDSLAETCLTHTFNLLKVETPVEAQTQVRKVGRKGTQQLSKLLKVLDENYLEAHVNWQSPTDKFFTWEGKLGRIRELSQTFDRIVANEPEEVAVEGTVYTESIRKRFEVQDASGFIYGGSVPDSLMNSLTALRVGEPCRAILLETIHENPTTGQQQKLYQLKYIAPLPAQSTLQPTQLSLF